MFYLCYFCILNILLYTVERIVNVKLYILYFSCLNWIHCFKHIRCHMCGSRLDLCWVTPVQCISNSRPRVVSFFTSMSTPTLEPSCVADKARLSPETDSEVMYWVVLFTVPYILMMWFLSKYSESFTYLKYTAHPILQKGCVLVNVSVSRISIMQTIFYFWLPYYKRRQISVEVFLPTVIIKTCDFT
jgi:hypothetical protein